jgi:hypothetical protein
LQMGLHVSALLTSACCRQWLPLSVHSRAL